MPVQVPSLFLCSSRSRLGIQITGLWFPACSFGDRQPFSRDAIASPPAQSDAEISCDRPWGWYKCSRVHMGNVKRSLVHYLCPSCWNDPQTRSELLGLGFPRSTAKT
ncbi:hypothetical protein JAAARDRAFT_545053 [Jaapia argillacea MUCL 33604]|uniref:Uncharacterized protein n=1 Tax=Jaapia argillacea MUCL 33604 TaxID=933084 RepID=A0A067PK85_9AGAM|nr:hypothetical protein JAAARDRAFT_545053 [Jaapia argillacea MUCL 33604]